MPPYACLCPALHLVIENVTEQQAFQISETEIAFWPPEVFLSFSSWAVSITNSWKSEVCKVESLHLRPPYFSWQGLLFTGTCSTCTIIVTQGWSPTVPERWPLRPWASGFVFWSFPNDSSPGPISTRVPSMVSTNQRPESGTIHCGFGFSCHSPTQSTGRTMTITWVPGLLSRSTQDDAAPFDMLSNLKSLSSQRSWWLTPFSSVQTCQYGIR